MRMERTAEFPWKTLTSTDVDVARVQAALDRDHFGLADVKQRVLEYVAVLARHSRTGGDARNVTPLTLLLAGPPGTGKSNFVESIARPR